MSEAQTPAALSIGAVLGDSDASNRRWRDVISQLGLAVRTAVDLDEVETAVRVNVVFHTAGKYNTNPFEGVRTGRFNRKDSHLLVQAAVPAGPIEDPDALLLQLLIDAVTEAEAFARKRGIAESLPELRAVVGRVAAE